MYFILTRPKGVFDFLKIVTVKATQTRRASQDLGKSYVLCCNPRMMFYF